MTTLQRISKLTGYSEAYITGKDYKGHIKNVRMAAIWIMKEEFDIAELAIIFGKRDDSIRRIISNVQGLLEVEDKHIKRLIDLFYQSGAKQLKNALKEAVDSWDKSTTYDMHIFTKGMEFQAKKI